MASVSASDRAGYAARWIGGSSEQLDECKEGFMKKVGVLLAILVLLVGGLPALAAAPPSAEREFVVLYAEGASLDAARAAVKAAGGTIVRENAAVGVATVRTSNPNFIAA